MNIFNNLRLNYQFVKYLFTVHYYNYILDSWNPNIYPTPRFASEYGYQSLPSVETFLQVTNNISDLHINGAFLHHRQHHPLGNAEMLLLMSFQLRLPDSRNKNFDKAIIFYSQVRNFFIYLYSHLLIISFTFLILADKMWKNFIFM